MTVRLGIELTPSRCTLVSLHDGPGELQIRDFHTIEYSAGDANELHEELRRLALAKRFRQPARLVVWNGRALHAVASVPAGASDQLEDEAVARLRAHDREFDTWASDAWLGVAQGSSFTLADGRPGREVLLAAMAADDVRRCLRPFLRAGFVIDRVMTPALALTGLASRVAGADRSLTAFVAMNRDMGQLTIMRGTRLLLARRLSWTFRVEHTRVDERLAERYEFAARVASELRPAFEQVTRDTGLTVDHVVACGDLPNIRSIAMPLIEELDVEVETVDDVDGVDVQPVADLADLLVEQSSTLCLAMAAASATPVVQLASPMRVEPRSGSALRVAIGAMAAAAIVMLAVALRPPTALPSSDHGRIAVATPADHSAAGLGATLGSGLPRSPAPAEVATRPSAPVASAGARSTDIELRAARSAVGSPGETVPSVPAPTLPGLEPGGAGAGDEPAPAGEPAEPVPEPPGSATGRPAVSEPTPAPQGSRTEIAAAPAAVPPVAPPVELPEVRSILHSSDRRLALVGRQVVGVGDSIAGAMVVDITRDAVVVRLPSGEERRLTLTYGLGAPAR